MFRRFSRDKKIEEEEGGVEPKLETFATTTTDDVTNTCTKHINRRMIGGSRNESGLPESNSDISPTSYSPTSSLQQRAGSRSRSSSADSTEIGSSFRRFSSSRFTSKDRWDNKQRTYIARLFVTFKECLSDLNATNVTRAKLEKMAIFIHESMSNSSRNYHSVQHVFDISKDIDDPIGILAAMFHDCIYYHVDGEFTKDQTESLVGAYQKAAAVESNNNNNNKNGGPLVFKMSIEDLEQYQSLALVQTIFGYQPDTEIALLSGLNEFLSAVVAVRMLEEHISMENLAIIAACIEATIPFRNLNTENPMDKLYNNLCTARDKFNLQLSEDEIIEAVQLAVQLSNEDVGNFGSSDRLYFLDNTWSLLPETNIALRTQHLYTVQQYQLTMFKMNGFFNFLKPRAVISCFRGFPEQDEIDEFVTEAERNLEIGRKYVGIKYLSASILAAFAEITGGDAPMSMFMGDLPNRHLDGQKLEDSLPITCQDDVFNKGNCDNDVYKILHGGRKTDTTFDIRKSPISAYLYAIIGDVGLATLLNDPGSMYPMDIDRAKSLLVKLPSEIVILLAKNMAIIAMPRSDQLIKLSSNFYKKVDSDSDEDEEEANKSGKEKEVDYEELFEGIVG